MSERGEGSLERDRQRKKWKELMEKKGREGSVERRKKGMERKTWKEERKVMKECKEGRRVGKKRRFLWEQKTREEWVKEKKKWKST